MYLRALLKNLPLRVFQVTFTNLSVMRQNWKQQSLEKMVFGSQYVTPIVVYFLEVVIKTSILSIFRLLLDGSK